MLCGIKSYTCIVRGVIVRPTCAPAMLSEADIFTLSVNVCVRVCVCVQTKIPPIRNLLTMCYGDPRSS